MDYQRIYREFISDRKSKPEPEGYTERHHILPRALGGGDEPENLIKLTAREHYFAHCCLAKAYGGKMWSALFAVAHMSKTDDAWRYFCRRRMVESCRSKAAQERSNQMKKLWASGAFKRNRQYRPWTEQERDQRRKAMLGRKNSIESVYKSRQTRLKNSPRHEFLHIDGREFCGTQYDLRNYSGLSQPMVSCLIRGKIKTAKGWMLKGTDPKAINGRDPTVREFVHNDGRRFVGTVYDFLLANAMIDSGSVSKMVNGKLGKVNGWRIVLPAPKE